MNDNKRHQQVFNEPVAIENNMLIVLDYVFKVGEGSGGFKGAVGSVYQPISRNEFDYRADVEQLTEGYEDLWRMEVYQGGVTVGLDEWVADAISMDGAEQLAFPDRLWDDDKTEQFREALGMDEEEAYIFEMVGGGRCFDVGNREGLTVINEELWSLIELYETQS